MKPHKITLFIACIIASLGLMSFVFPRDGVKVWGHTLYFPSFHSLVDDDQRQIEIVEKTVPPEVTHLEDSILHYRSVVSDGELRFWLPDSNFFDSFWKTVERARDEKRVVRILHYGDSQIEMDHITSRLRRYMQGHFGGGGPGMMPFNTITPTFAVSQSSAGNLIHIASFGDSTVVRSKGNYGPMMQCFRSEGEASVSFRASRHKSVDSLIRQFSHIKVVYNSRGGKVSGTLVDVTGNTTKKQTGVKGVGSMEWRTDAPSQAVKVKVHGAADLYCVMVDDGPGVAVDNIPMRGCSGQQFTMVNKELLTSAYSQMDVGMIIMQFGGNSVPYLKKGRSISDYCKSIGRQIDYVQKCCPGAKILFIGPSDMSTRVRGELQTYPCIPDLIDSLIATAIAHGAAYWSIYHAMGGENSMPQWSKRGLAGKDNIHFSQRGADLMGDKLAEAFDNSYVLYRLERRRKQYDTEENQ